MFFSADSAKTIFSCLFTYTAGAGGCFPPTFTLIFAPYWPDDLQPELISECSLKPSIFPASSLYLNLFI
jgi:hypothetical protein